MMYLYQKSLWSCTAPNSHGPGTNHVPIHTVINTGVSQVVPNPTETTTPWTGRCLQKSGPTIDMNTQATNTSGQHAIPQCHCQSYGSYPGYHYHSCTTCQASPAATLEEMVEQGALNAQKEAKQIKQLVLQV